MANGGGTGRGRGYLLFQNKKGRKNTYLGILFSGVKGMFNTHVEDAIKKAKRLKGVIRNYRPTPKGRSSGMIGRIVIPSILYGAEIFDMADRDKRKLETIERQVGRWAKRADRVAFLELKR